LLASPRVRDELRRAWEESAHGPVGGKEQGGFICQTDDGRFLIDRWPVGTDCITVPPHPACRRNGELIVASFHTHPHTGPDYAPWPSAMDREEIRRDADLKDSGYLGEFVISAAQIYLIHPDGSYVTIGDMTLLL